MRRHCSPALVTGLAAAALFAPSAHAADTLDAVFARLDKASAGFSGLTANIRRTEHTELVNADQTDEGTISVKRFKPGDSRVLIHFTKPDERWLFLGGGKAQVYNPKANEVQVADIRKHRNLVNELLLLSFGATSAQLKAAYDVKLGGQDTVNGIPTSRLELIPKNEEIRHSIKKCELWVPENGIPVQQKLHETGGDYQVATYTEIALKPNLPDSAVRLDLPKGVKTIPIK